MFKKLYITFMIASIAVLNAFSAEAAPLKKPLDIISTSITDIIENIQKPEFKENQELKDDVFIMITDLFSWEDMGKRSLGRIWKAQTNEQQQSFIKAFTELLRTNYFNQLEGYKGEKVEYNNERIKGKYAEVQTEVIRNDGTKTPVYYRLITTKDNEWKIYDVVIEGVSMVKNYKTQFDEILKKKSFDQFIQQISEKADTVKEQEA